MTRVSIISCADYDPARVRRAVREAVVLVGGMAAVIKPGERVLLKANLLAPVSPDEAVTTHPAVVKAVAELVKEAGGTPFVADSPGYVFAGGKKGESGRKCRAVIACGIWQVGDDLGMEATQFEAQENPYIEVDVPGGVMLKKIYAARLALEADAIITLPKLKTHASTWYTGAIKNMFGAVATRTRKQAHRLATFENFNTSLVDVYAVFQPKIRLAVMDGIMGMEGEGPRHGKLRAAEVVLASTDPVALDSVASQVIGFDPLQIFTTRAAAERGFGVGNPAAIEVVGRAVSEVAVDFEKPSGRRLNIPPLLMKLADHLIKVRPFCNNDLCDRCGICAKSCPVDAISMSPYPDIDRDICIECYCCNEMCPTGAMKIRKNWLAQRVG